MHFILSPIFSVFAMVGDVDHWIDLAKECKYLPENDLKVNHSCALLGCQIPVILTSTIGLLIVLESHKYLSWLSHLFSCESSHQDWLVVLELICCSSKFSISITL